MIGTETHSSPIVAESHSLGEGNSWTQERGARGSQLPVEEQCADQRAAAALRRRRPFATLPLQRPSVYEEHRSPSMAFCTSVIQKVLL